MITLADKSHMCRRVSIAMVVASAIVTGSASSALSVPLAPGDQIENRATLHADGLAPAGLTASFRFTVAETPSHAPTLTVMGYAPEVSGVASYRLSGTAHSVSGSEFGPYVASNAPVLDRTGQTASLDAVLPLAPIDYIERGVALFFVLSDRESNKDPTLIESVTIALRDSSTGDIEFLEFFETSPDSGVFLAWANTGSGAAAPGDGVISSTGASTITASFASGSGAGIGLEVSVTTGGASPTGTVFDSRTGEPLDGIWITIVDAESGEPAEVFGDDGEARYPAQVASGGVARDQSGEFYEFGPGAFLFPDLKSGRYRFVLSGLPADYKAPSQLLDAMIVLPDGGALTQGSRLESFEVTDISRYRIDIPLDHVSPGALDRSQTSHELSPGEMAGVTVTLALPTSAGPLDLLETLPVGIEYVPGSMRVNGQPVSPVQESSTRLVLPDLAQYGAQDIEITYTIQLSLSADSGTVAVSHSALVDAQGNTLLAASTDLRIAPAFDADKMLLIGRVLADGCAGSLPDIDLSGLRVLLESGEIATTDKDGRFSFRALSARPHVARLDEQSLPEGVEPVACTTDTRSAGAASSQFIRARGGMMDRVVFHVAVDPDRADRLAKLAAEQNSWRPRDPAAGLDQDWLDAHEGRAEPGLVSPPANFLPASQAIDVVVLREKGQTAEILVDGSPVDDMRAERPIASRSGALVMERYRAVRVKEGRTEIALTLRDAKGEIVLSQTRDVLFATTPAHAEVVEEGSRAWSDGRTLPHIRLRLSDEAGIALRPGTMVQLRVDAPDALMPVVARKSSSGYERRARQDISIMVRDDGIAEFDLAPIATSRDVHVRVMSPERDLQVPIHVESRERPWVLVGLAEAVVANSGLRAHLRPADEDLGPISGRLGLFAEGIIKGKYLMTLRIDTARDGTGPMETLDPERDYLVYGDRSREEDGAPSRFPLYLRLASEEAELLVGDFETDLDKGLVELSRKVTGARVMFEDSRWKVLAFAAGLENGHQEDRIALDGTLGPFALSHGDIAPGSEQLRVVRVGGLDLGREISSERLLPGIDYRLDARSGRIYLMRSWPAFDPEMNRYVLVAQYQQNDDARDAGLVVGGRVEYKLNETVTLGASGLHGSDVEGARVEMAGVDVTWSPRSDLSVELAAAETRKSLADLQSDGQRMRLEARYEGEEGSAYLRAERRRGVNGFDASMQREDLDQLALGATLDIADPRYAWLTEEDPVEGWRHSIQGLGERDASNGDTTLDARLLSLRYSGENAIGGGFRLRSEARATQETRDMASAILRGEFALGDGKGFIQSEVAIVGHGIPVSDRIAVGYDRDAGSKLGHHASFEIARAREDGNMTTSFGYGVDWKVNETLTLSGGVGLAANGTRKGGSWRVGVEDRRDLDEHTRFEFGMTAQSDLGAADIPLSMGTDNPYIEKSFLSSRVDLRHTRERWSAGASLSGIKRDDSHAVTLRLAADGEVAEGLSIGAEGQFTIGREPGGAPLHDERFRLAMAWRKEETDPFVMGFLEHDLKRGRETITYGELLGSFPLSSNDQLTLRAALKHSDFGGVGGGGTVGLLGAEWRHQITDKVDFGLHGALMSDLSGRAGRVGSIGASIGLTPFENTWVGIGYNATGFEEKHFSANGTTAKGVFVEMRFKFDEKTVQGLFR